MTNWNVKFDENGDITEIIYTWTDRTSYIFKDGLLFERFNDKLNVHYAKMNGGWTRAYVEIPKNDVKKAKRIAYRALKKYTMIFD